MSDLVTRLQGIVNEVTQQLQDVDKQKQEWKVVGDKIEKSLQPRVKLNVGGMKFVTTFQTLKSHPGSFFDALLSGKWNIEDTVFIDRDGNTFKYVLDFMRGDPLDVQALSPAKHQRLIKEAEFFQLDKLITLLNTPPPTPPTLSIFSATLKSPSMVINGNEISINEGGHSAVLGNEEYSTGVILFKFSVIKAGSWIFFGIGKEPLPSATSYNHPNTYGWASSKQLYTAGKTGTCEEINVTSGDNVTLQLDCENNFLLFKNATKWSPPFIHQLPPGMSWRLHINLYDAGTRVKLVEKTLL